MAASPKIAQLRVKLFALSFLAALAISVWCLWYYRAPVYESIGGPCSTNLQVCPAKVVYRPAPWTYLILIMPAADLILLVWAIKQSKFTSPR